MRGSHLAWLSTAACTLLGCSVYDTSLLAVNPVANTGGTSSAGGGGSSNGGAGGGQGGINGGGAGGGGGAGAVCSHVTYPPAPINVPASTKDLEMVAVMYDIDLGDSTPNTAVPPTRYRTLGFDLDHLCTTVDTLTKAECLLPAYATGVLDGPDGQDNALGNNIQFIRDRISNFSSAIYTQGLQKGQSANVIVHMTGYNGELNDDTVRVETMVAADFYAFDPTKTAVPKWDGNDVWPIASDSVTANDRSRPKFVDPNAYVNNGKVVVSLPEATLRLITQLSPSFKINLSLVMHGASVVCDLVTTTQGKWGYTAQNCVLGARWKVDDVIHQLSQFQDPLSPLSKPIHLCSDSNAYGVFKNSLCSVTDTYSGIAAAHTPCDSLSMGLTFNTKPALLGDVFTVPPPKTDWCPPATDPANDDCESLLLEGGAPPGSGGTTSTGGKTGAGGHTSDAGTGGTAGAGGIKDAGKG